MLEVGGPSSEINDYIFIICQFNDRFPKSNEISARAYERRRILRFHGAKIRL